MAKADKEAKEAKTDFVRASELVTSVDVATLENLAKQLAMGSKEFFRVIRDTLASHGIYVSRILEAVVGDKALEVFTYNLYIRLVPLKSGEWEVEVKVIK